MAAAPPLRRTDSAQGDFSPLKHFVLAKKKISEVFQQLLNYVEETAEFVEGERVLITGRSFSFDQRDAGWEVSELSYLQNK